MNWLYGALVGPMFKASRRIFIRILTCNVDGPPPRLPRWRPGLTTTPPAARATFPTALAAVETRFDNYSARRTRHVPHRACRGGDQV